MPLFWGWSDMNHLARNGKGPFPFRKFGHLILDRIQTQIVGSKT